MNPSELHQGAGGVGGGPERVEVLISRVVDGEASHRDWDELRALAEADAKVWRWLAETQRDHMSLARGVAAHVSCADRVDAPVDRVHAEAARARMQGRTRLAAAWAGWAAAAAIGLAAIGVRVGHPGGSASQAGLGGIGQAEQAVLNDPTKLFDRYLTVGKEQGVVLGEIPTRTMLAAEPLPDGAGYRVTYSRQVIEQAIVPQLYQAGSDELGRPAPVRADLMVPASTRRVY